MMDLKKQSLYIPEPGLQKSLEVEKGVPYKRRTKRSSSHQQSYFAPDNEDMPANTNKRTLPDRLDMLYTFATLKIAAVSVNEDESLSLIVNVGATSTLVVEKNCVQL